MTAAAVLGSATTRVVGQHFWHIVLLAAWCPIFGLVVLWERLKAGDR